ncbi:hypothetical protein CHS0354_031000 [Potamilus streckersoni]|uniref:C1q domain-containing protein n=1 Tax=Potamilus streckersoni TaxID=2493646 RepID=A0AAE0S323_9BIVA|nr:hypothetical protein CHS0354_031000 [Potamilus streckersoni]
MEMSNEMKQLRLQHDKFLQNRKELLLTLTELQCIKDEQLKTKHVIAELIIDLLKTNEKMKMLEKEKEGAIEGVKHTYGFQNVRTDGQKYSDNTHSNETIQEKTIFAEFPGRKINIRGVKRSPVVPKVAFRATISSTLSGFNNRGQALVFDNVQLNIGDGYSKHSGIFRAPVAGLYVVLLTISTDSSTIPDVLVVRNGSRLCATVPSVVDHSYAGSPCTCNVMAKLMQGDEVWPQVYSRKATDRIRDCMWSTFSVALLSMDGSASS